LHHAVSEFWLAEDAYQKMQDISLSIAEHELLWREVLRRIERIYGKAKAACCNEPGWAKLNSEVSHLRKTDPLLLYVQQARHADEHSVQKMALPWDPLISIKGNGKGSIVAKFRPWNRTLLPVVNRGVKFDPPKVHLGKDFSQHLDKGKEETVIVAFLALSFYFDFINLVSIELYPHIGLQP